MPFSSLPDVRDQRELATAIGHAVAASLNTGETYTVVRFLDVSRKPATPSGGYHAISVLSLSTSTYAPLVVETMGIQATVNEHDMSLSVCVRYDIGQITAAVAARTALVERRRPCPVCQDAACETKSLECGR